MQKKHILTSICSFFHVVMGATPTQPTHDVVSTSFQRWNNVIVVTPEHLIDVETTFERRYVSYLEVFFWLTNTIWFIPKYYGQKKAFQILVKQSQLAYDVVPTFKQRHFEATLKLRLKDVMCLLGWISPYTQYTKLIFFFFRQYWRKHWYG